MVSNHQELHPNLCSTAKPRAFQNVDGFLCSLTITCHKASVRHKDTSHPHKFSVASLSWDGGGQKLTQTAFGEEGIDVLIKLSKMTCIYGLSCVIHYFHGILQVQALVTILSLLMLPLF